jgi:hypothetical protein
MESRQRAAGFAFESEDVAAYLLEPLRCAKREGGNRCQIDPAPPTGRRLQKSIGSIT